MGTQVGFNFFTHDQRTGGSMIAPRARTIPRREAAPQVSTTRDRIPTVTGSTFQRLVLEARGPIVVEFMSYGCGHCRLLEPILQEVAELLESKEQFFRVNLAVEPELAEEYEVEGTPTFLMFLDGAEVGRVDGVRPSRSTLMTAVTRPFSNQQD
jgi:thioredoxin 1